MESKIVAFVIWLVAGILTLCNKNIDKASYALVWIALMINLFVNIFNT